MSKEDLQLVETQELIKELINRFDVVVFLATRHEKQGINLVMNYTLSQPFTSIGLAHEFIRYLNKRNEDVRSDTKGYDREG